MLLKTIIASGGCLFTSYIHGMCCLFVLLSSWDWLFIMPGTLENGHADISITRSILMIVALFNTITMQFFDKFTPSGVYIVCVSTKPDNRFVSCRVVSCIFIFFVSLTLKPNPAHFSFVYYFGDTNSNRLITCKYEMYM